MEKRRARPSAMRRVAHAGPFERPLLLLCAAVMLLLLACPSPARAATPDTTIYLLDTVFSTAQSTSDQAEALAIGIRAAFFASNNTANHRRIELFRADGLVDDPTDIEAVVAKGLELHPDLLAVVGPYSDVTLNTVLASDLTERYGLVYLGPFTGSSAVRRWSNATYFTRAEPLAELKVIMKHLLNEFRARRVAFMYLTGVHFGDKELDSLQATLQLLSREPAAVYAAPHQFESVDIDEAAFDAMANTRPQVILVWGMAGTQLVAFVQRVLTDQRTASAYIMTSFALQPFVFRAYEAMVDTGAVDPSVTRLFSSATAHPPNDLGPLYIQQFRREITRYLSYTPMEVKGVAHPSKSSEGVASEADARMKQLMVLGWLSGKLIQQTLEQSSWITDRAAYKAGLFQQNRYIIGGDYVLGNYGGECNAMASRAGAVCECNQGGHTTIMTSFVGGEWVVLEESIFTYPQSMCTSEDVRLSRPMNIMTLMFNDHPELLEMGVSINKIIPAMMSLLEVVYQKGNFATLNTTAETAQAMLDEEVSNYWVDLVAGPITRDMDAAGLLVAMPTYPKANLVVNESNYLYLMPTLEQELYVLHTYLDVVARMAESNLNLNVVLYGYAAKDAAQITEIIRKTSDTFNTPVPSVSTVDEAGSITPSLQAGRMNLVLGIRSADVSAMVRFLAASASSVVMVSFNDFSLSYDAIAAAFAAQPPSVRARFVTFNSLPLWTDASPEALDAYPVLGILHALYNDTAAHTPYTLSILTAAGFIQALAGTQNNVDGATLAENAYRHGVVTTYGISFGPFRWGCTLTAVGEDCAYVNYGARGIALLSMEQVLDPSVNPLTPPLSPVLVYAPRPAALVLTTTQLGGIIAGSVVSGVLLIAAAAAMVYCCVTSRSNNMAPRTHEDPVTVIFTDIESSTALWAALPQEMADAIAAHHRVIRQLIKKYGCYEVKTVGDSFMIACKDAYSAVQLACDIQTRLLKHDWGTAKIDVKYREFELVKSKTVAGYVPPTARLSEEVYAALWAGLRVRIGIHTGLSDIRYDEVMKRYDYYGDTSNMAARTEAIANGGQVVATETTWWALSDVERDALKETTMGSQGLRGVLFAVGMHQLNPVPGRTHAALRTEIDAIVPDKDAAEIASNGDEGAPLLSSSDDCSGPAANVALVISGTFAPYPVAQRVRELQPLLIKWSVSVPPRNPSMAEEDYCQSLINRLAIRIASVTQAKQRLQEDAVAGVTEAPLSPCRASNPLLGDAVVSSIYVKRPLLGEAPAAQERHATIHESPTSRVSGTAPFPPLTPHRRTSRSRSPVDWRGDGVEPLRSPANRTHSLDSSERVGGPGAPLEAVVVAVPRDIRLRHRRTNSDVSEMALSEA